MNPWLRRFGQVLRNAANTRCVKASGSCFSHHLTSSHVASSRESRSSGLSAATSTQTAYRSGPSAGAAHGSAEGVMGCAEEARGCGNFTSTGQLMMATPLFAQCWARLAHATRPPRKGLPQVAGEGLDGGGYKSYSRRTYRILHRGIIELSSACRLEQP